MEQSTCVHMSGICARHIPSHQLYGDSDYFWDSADKVWYKKDASHSRSPAHFETDVCDHISLDISGLRDTYAACVK